MENNNARLKLCVHCNAQSDVANAMCPYCGADFSEQYQEAQPPVQSRSYALSENETLSSLYPPPYRPENFSIPKEQVMPQGATPPTASVPQKEKTFGFFWPTLLLFLGVYLLVIGVCQFLFSSHGELLLSFDARFWFLYVAIACPLLFYGIKQLNSCESKET